MDLGGQQVLSVAQLEGEDQDEVSTRFSSNSASILTRIENDIASCWEIHDRMQKAIATAKQLVPLLQPERESGSSLHTKANGDPVIQQDMAGLLDNRCSKREREEQEREKKDREEREKEERERQEREEGKREEKGKKLSLKDRRRRDRSERERKEREEKERREREEKEREEELRTEARNREEKGGMQPEVKLGFLQKIKAWNFNQRRARIQNALARTCDTYVRLDLQRVLDKTDQRQREWRENLQRKAREKEEKKREKQRIKEERDEMKKMRRRRQEEDRPKIKLGLLDKLNYWIFQERKRANLRKIRKTRNPYKRACLITKERKRQAEEELWKEQLREKARRKRNRCWFIQMIWPTRCTLIETLCSYDSFILHTA